MKEEAYKIHKSWKKVLHDEFEKDYFKDLNTFLNKEYSTSKIFPSKDRIFESFQICPFDKVKIVIIGQDPYHDDDQAIGLSFAVRSGTKLPPSLKNIFKEVKSDLGIETVQDGDLSRWAVQGVLLLNSTLTVRAHSPASHKNKGWEQFTDEIIKVLSTKRDNLVFILWGNFAKQKAELIDSSKHYIIESPHPSPFSARKGFFGSKPFSKSNKYLKQKGLNEMDWR